MVLRIVLSVISAICALLFALTAIPVMTSNAQGYGIEIQTIQYGIGFGVAALISFSSWLFLKAK
jgi:hypothetical protein